MIASNNDFNPAKFRTIDARLNALITRRATEWLEGLHDRLVDVEDGSRLTSITNDVETHLALKSLVPRLQAIPIDVASLLSGELQGKPKPVTERQIIFNYAQQLCRNYTPFAAAQDTASLNDTWSKMQFFLRLAYLEADDDLIAKLSAATVQLFAAEVDVVHPTPDDTLKSGILLDAMLIASAHRYLCLNKDDVDRHTFLKEIASKAVPVWIDGPDKPKRGNAPER